MNPGEHLLMAHFPHRLRNSPGMNCVAKFYWPLFCAVQTLIQRGGHAMVVTPPKKELDVHQTCGFGPGWTFTTQNSAYQRVNTFRIKRSVLYPRPHLLFKAPVATIYH